MAKALPDDRQSPGGCSVLYSNENQFQQLKRKSIGMRWHCYADSTVFGWRASKSASCTGLHLRKVGESGLMRQDKKARHKKGPLSRTIFVSTWCPEEDSNLHEVAPAST